MCVRPRASLLALTIAACLAMQPAFASSAEPAPAAVESLIVTASISEEPSNVVYEFQPEGDALRAPVDTWTALGVVLTEAETAQSTLLSSDLGITFQHDAENAHIRFHLPSTRRPLQRLGENGIEVPAVGPMPKGVLLNYDLAVSADRYGVNPDLGHELRFGTFGGVFSMYGRVSRDGYWFDSATWTRDLLDSARVVQLGNVFGGPSNVAGSPGLLGVRYASDASLILNSERGIPRLGGIADRRSTVELYLNERLASQSDIQTGPYAFDRLPVTTGYNRVRMVVRDEQGREQVVERAFFYDPRLLPKGESEFDVSAGLIQDTSEFGATGFYRRGLGDRWTAGVGLQVGPDGRALTLENAFAVPHLEMIGLDVGVSQGPQGNGYALALNTGYRAEQWSVAFSHARRSNWWDLSVARMALPTNADQQTTSISFVYSPKDAPWSASAALVDARYGDRDSRALDLGISYGFDRHDFGFRAGYDFANEAGWTVGLTYGYTFGNRTRVRTNVTNDDRGTRVNGSVSGQFWDDHPTRQPVYWNANVSHSDNGSSATVAAATRLTAFDLDGQVATNSQGDTRLYGRVAGSVWMGQGGVLFQRPVSDSFALVKAEGYAEAPISMNYQPVGTVNRQGYVLAPYVPSHYPLTFRADASEAPFGTTLAGELAPTAVGRRSGVLVVFPTATRAMEVIAVDAAGEPLPMGTVLKGPNQAEALVGNAGTVWIDAAAQGDVWTSEPVVGEPCTFTLPEPSDAVLTLTCRVAAP